MNAKAYAKVVGRPERTVANEVCAARVASTVAVNGDDLSSLSTHLVEIHAVPSWLWRALVVELLARGWTVEANESALLQRLARRAEEGQRT